MSGIILLKLCNINVKNSIPFKFINSQKLLVLLYSIIEFFDNLSLIIKKFDVNMRLYSYLIVFI